MIIFTVQVIWMDQLTGSEQEHEVSLRSVTTLNEVLIENKADLFLGVSAGSSCFLFHDFLLKHSLSGDSLKTTEPRRFR